MRVMLALLILAGLSLPVYGHAEASVITTPGTVITSQTGDGPSLARLIPTSGRPGVFCVPSYTGYSCMYVDWVCNYFGWFWPGCAYPGWFAFPQ